MEKFKEFFRKGKNSENTRKQVGSPENPTMKGLGDGLPKQTKEQERIQEEINKFSLELEGLEKRRQVLKPREKCSIEDKAAIKRLGWQITEVQQKIMLVENQLGSPTEQPITIKDIKEAINKIKSEIEGIEGKIPPNLTDVQPSQNETTEKSPEYDDISKFEAIINYYSICEQKNLEVEGVTEGEHKADLRDICGNFVESAKNLKEDIFVIKVTDGYIFSLEMYYDALHQEMMNGNEVAQSEIGGDGNRAIVNWENTEKVLRAYYQSIGDLCSWAKKNKVEIAKQLANNSDGTGKYPVGDYLKNEIRQDFEKYLNNLEQTVGALLDTYFKENEISDKKPIQQLWQVACYYMLEVMAKPNNVGSKTRASEAIWFAGVNQSLQDEVKKALKTKVTAECRSLDPANRGNSRPGEGVKLSDDRCKLSIQEFSQATFIPSSDQTSPMSMNGIVENLRIIMKLDSNIQWALGKIQNSG